MKYLSILSLIERNVGNAYESKTLKFQFQCVVVSQNNIYFYLLCIKCKNVHMEKKLKVHVFRI